MSECEKEWYESMSSMNEKSSVSYWNKRAHDYNDFIKTSAFCYGEKIVDILLNAGFLNSRMKVLEIAGGVGALTLPLGKHTNWVTTIEPAKQMAENMMENALLHGIDNISILLETCQETAERPAMEQHDATIMCHASWQFPDLQWLVKFMETNGRGNACIADSHSGMQHEKADFLAELGVHHQSIDRFEKLCTVIRSYGRQPEIEEFPFTMRRSAESARSMMEKVLSKYRTPMQVDIERIAHYVEEHSDSGIYQEETTMGVMWWQNKDIAHIQ